MEEKIMPTGDAGISSLLRISRENLGYDVNFVAEHLRIRVQYLIAIEENRFEDLPGPAYALGFIRSYANFLGLSGDDAVNMYKREKSKSSKVEETADNFEQSIDGDFKGFSNFFSNIYVLIFVGSVVLGYLGFLIYSHFAHENRPRQAAASSVQMRILDEENKSEERGEKAESNVKVVHGELTPTAKKTTEEAENKPSRVILGLDTKLPEASAEVAAPERVKPAVSYASAQESRVATEYGLSNAGAAKIVITANEESWIQVIDRNNSSLFNKNIYPGDKYYVPDEERIVLRTGNMRGLRFKVDGVELPVFSGKVRNIMLDPENLKTGELVPVKINERNQVIFPEED